MRFVDATTLNLIGKAQPTSQPYHRIDTVAYKGFTKSENQQVRCGAGLALVFKTNSSRIDLLPEYTSFVYTGLQHPAGGFGGLRPLYPQGRRMGVRRFARSP